MQRPYVSIDIETTGLDREACQILEIGLVIDDWVSPVEKLASLRTYVYHDKIVGEPFALSMPSNVETLRKLAKVPRDVMMSAPDRVLTFENELYSRPAAVGKLIARWLAGNGIDAGRVLAAGKNFASFDRQFLERLPNFNIHFHHRTVDPCMLFWNPVLDQEPPSTKTCMERAGVGGEVAHTTVEDAIGVIKMVRYVTSRPAAPQPLVTDDGRAVPSTAEAVARRLAAGFLARGQYTAQKGTK